MSEKIAFHSTLLLSTSIWFCYARKMMPDTYCISLMFIALYFGIRFLKDKKNYQILIYLVFSSLAILSKIPAGIYFIVPLIFLFDKKYRLRNRILLGVATLPALISTYWWYFVWNPHLSQKFGNWYNSGVSFKEGASIIFHHLGKVAHSFYFDSFFSYIAFAIFIAGLVLMFVKKEKKLIIAFVFPLLVFVVYILKSGPMFLQSYYIIPFVPVMALVGGYALSLIHLKWLCYVLLVAAMLESIANQSHDFLIKKSEQYKMSLPRIIQKIASKNDQIAVNGNGNPQLLYLSHHKGWIYDNEDLFDTNYIQRIKRLDCRFLVVDKHQLKMDGNRLKLPYKQAFENVDFVVYDLEKKAIIKRK